MKTKSRQARKALTEFMKGSSILTSSQKQDLTFRLGGEKPDYHNWYVDFRLLDAYNATFSDSKLLEQVHLSVKDKRITKMFYHRDVMVENAESFLGTEATDHSWNENVRVAAHVVWSQIKTTLEPMILNANSDIEEFWSDRNASAGAIGRGSKADNARLCLEDALKIKKLVQTQDDWSTVWIPAIGFHRGQISGFVNEDELDVDSLKEKDRLVWGLDGASVTVEGQYAIPLINHLSSHWITYAGGKTPEELRTLIHCQKCPWVSIDYSKFDQTIPSWLISLCFRLIKRMFSENYHRELDWIEYNFIHTRLVMNGGLCVQKHKGIPSGSYFTQAVGSMANAIMMYAYLASLVNGAFEDKVRRIKSMVKLMLTMGDDNLMFCQSGISLDDMAGYVETVFGVHINPSKCGYGGRNDNPEFLKREWRDDGEYMNPLYLIVNTIHPEKERDYDGYSPWHIMYGLYLTYKSAFPRYCNGIEMEKFLIKQMQSHGGVSVLVNMEPKDLPGVFRPYGRRGLERIRRSAERALRIA